MMVLFDPREENGMVELSYQWLFAMAIVFWRHGALKIGDICWIE